MKCINCNHEINNDTIKCPFCGHNFEKNKSKIEAICNYCGTNINYKTSVCPRCGRKHAISSSFGLKLFIGLFLLFSFGPFLLAFIIMVFCFALDSKVLNINELVKIIKTIIYIVICIPLFIAILGYTGKILKNSQKKDTICLVLSIISIVGLIVFYTFTENSKIQFDDYDKQEYIILNNISVPTLYKITNYDNTFMAMSLKGIEDNIEAEEITIQTNEEIPNDILTSYKNILLNSEYSYLGILDEETEGYIYYENNYYMLVGFSKDNKNIVYLSFDQKNYQKFLEEVVIIKE
ncbi:MAG: hypothetical protein IJO33_02780 [Bacilli bacterium]|nr:hypothetical protein [Bacilli bacterium]